MGVSFALAVGILGFNVWQWYLAVIGIPQIEYMQSRISKAANYINTTDVYESYGCQNYMDNLHITFGTRNIIKMLLPIDWGQPVTGLEWTCLKIKYQQAM